MKPFTPRWRRYQRGDGDGLFIFVLACVLLFWGEPDVWDAIMKWATYWNTP